MFASRTADLVQPERSIYPGKTAISGTYAILGNSEYSQEYVIPEPHWSTARNIQRYSPNNRRECKTLALQNKVLALARDLLLAAPDERGDRSLMGAPGTTARGRDTMAVTSYQQRGPAGTGDLRQTS